MIATRTYHLLQESIPVTNSFITFKTFDIPESNSLFSEGFTMSTIVKIKSGKSWKHVNETPKENS